jgi:hypothetical protein
MTLKNERDNAEHNVIAVLHNVNTTWGMTHQCRASATISAPITRPAVTLAFDGLTGKATMHLRNRFRGVANSAAIPCAAIIHCPSGFEYR